MERVAPVALLYLQHWHTAIATSAHGLVAALVEHAPQVLPRCMRPTAPDSVRCTTSAHLARA